jgi:hypothetical protein
VGLEEFKSSTTIVSALATFPEGTRYEKGKELNTLLRLWVILRRYYSSIRSHCCDYS